jgi:hypothetical protein
VLIREVKVTISTIVGAASSRVCQIYVPIDLTNYSKVIASEAKQALRVSKRLLRHYAPRNDRLAEHFF